MAMLWVVIFVAVVGLQYGHGFPVKSTLPAYPHDTNGSPVLQEGWGPQQGIYTALPVLALVLIAVALLFGCTWCYRLKDHKLFTANAAHLHDSRRSNPPDSGFSEPVNNNVSEDNNNGPISLREMQNIANNNATAYIVSENEERNTVSRESVVEFEPLPSNIRVVDPLERCADWFGDNDLPRNRLQYLREIGRGWFGRVVEGEIEGEDSVSTVAVKILNQSASLEDKARFLDEAKIYRDVTHENVLRFITKCLQEDPWMLIFELCSMDLHQYLSVNRPKMAVLNESGVPLRIMTDVAAALSHLHTRGYVYGNLWSGNVLVRLAGESARAVLGQYVANSLPHDCLPNELRCQNAIHTLSSDVWSLGTLLWEICTWGSTPQHQLPPLPDLPCPYRNHLYQVMQLCWNPIPDSRPTAAQVYVLINHLFTTHLHGNETMEDDGYGSSDFEERWQRLKPNTIPKIDEHIAIVHAPSTSMVSHFTGSDQEFDNLGTVQDSLSVEIDTAVSRSSSVLSDKDPLSIQAKSESLTNLHGSLEDVRNIYLVHNESATLECHQANISSENNKDTDCDRSDSSVDPWLKDIMAGSQDDVSYYKDVSDVIKNLDNILNSEKTSSSESSHQASPSRDNLNLDCKKSHLVQSTIVKSPGIINFQNALEMGFDSKSHNEVCDDDNDDVDRDTIGSLNHSFERHSDTNSQHTLENITPDSPIKDLKISSGESHNAHIKDSEQITVDEESLKDNKLPKHNSVENSRYKPLLKEQCLAAIPSLSVNVCKSYEHLNESEDCIISCDNMLTEVVSTDSKNNITKSVGDMCRKEKFGYSLISPISHYVEVKKDILTESVSTVILNTQKSSCPSANEMLLPTVQNNRMQCGLTECNVEQINHVLPTSDDLISISSVTNNRTETPHSENTDSQLGAIIQKLREKYVNYKHGSIMDARDDKHIILPKSLEEIIKAVRYEINDIISTANDVISNIQEHEIVAYWNQNELLENEPSFIIAGDNKNIQEMYYGSPNKLKTSGMCKFPDSNELKSDTVLRNKEQFVLPNHIDQKFETSKNETITILPINKSASDLKAHTEEKTYNITNTNNVLPYVDKNEITDISENKDQLFEININISEINLDPNILPLQPPETVQNTVLSSSQVSTFVSPERVQKNDRSIVSDNQSHDSDQVESTIFKSDVYNTEKNDNTTKEYLNDSTAYLQLTETCDQISKEPIDDDVKHVIKSCLESSGSELTCSLFKNESTFYLDLPQIKNDTHNFLQSERLNSRQYSETFKCTSTPKESNDSLNDLTGNAIKSNAATPLPTKAPDYGPGVTLTKLEQKFVNEDMSPLESPSKSHHTETYEENSSIILGPFENYTLELFKGVKSNTEEILAFSSNFSEIDLETPSPLRDVNFLNEVPDIIPDLQYDNIESEIKVPRTIQQEIENKTDNDSSTSTEKRISPATPPNSPGNFLASVSKINCFIDNDMNSSNEMGTSESNSAVSTIYNDTDINQIELQLTAKLAMAENENNMNIEYSGPLTEERVPEIFMMDKDIEVATDTCLAGNGRFIENIRGIALDEESVQALRNELELKLPLAQVASIEPQVDGDSWSEQLPPPPELIVSYPGALSPIAEETGQQLTAYENDTNWTASTRTDSSESYPEPCNNSTERDDVTDAPGGSHVLPDFTNSLHSDESLNNTFTINRDVSPSKLITMSADSLNSSCNNKNIVEDSKSPSQDSAANKTDQEKQFSCERISQVSPFLVSPTTETSPPDNSDNLDNVTGVSTLSRTTQPTDAKLSKPFETQSPSKATSIDSWCSNDTLYNVEENFDDLALDPEIPQEYDIVNEEDNSESSRTLTHNEDEKELSRCSTYIIHDSKSDVCRTISADSVADNENNTYTVPKTELAEATPTALTKSEVNDSTKDTQTKDLAYGTLMSDLPSYSNCSTEVMSTYGDTRLFPQPELVRTSPIGDMKVMTPVRANKTMIEYNETPQLGIEAQIKKMESIDIADTFLDIHEQPNNCLIHNVNENDKSSFCHETIIECVTSTPLVNQFTNEDPKLDLSPLELPQIENIEDSTNSLPTLQLFLRLGKLQPQDSNLDNYNDGNTLTKNMNSHTNSEQTLTYFDFESSAVNQPQDMSALVKSNQSSEENSDFIKFKNFVKLKPQEVSINPQVALEIENTLSGVKSENFCTSNNTDFSNTELPHALKSPCPVPNNELFDVYGLCDEETDKNEQPLSIIITENSKNALGESPNLTYDSHKEDTTNIDLTYNSHTSRPQIDTEDKELKSSVYDSVNDELNKAFIDSSISNNSQIKLNTDNFDQPHTSNKEESIQNGEKYAIVSFINDTFEELLESNVDDSDNKEPKSINEDTEIINSKETPEIKNLGNNSLLENSNIADSLESFHKRERSQVEAEILNFNSMDKSDEKNIALVTKDFLQNEKQYCMLQSYFPFLNDIRFTGPTSEIMTTPFNQESPSEPNVPETAPAETHEGATTTADLLKDWDSDTDSHSTNSSSGEFIWKQRNGSGGGDAEHGEKDLDGAGSEASGDFDSCSGDSGSGSEGEEVEFVPSSWDCRAAPAKSSLRSLEQTPPQDSKKRVVFKRQKYHCVYEYPREVPDLETESSPTYLPDLSTYSDWDPSSVEAADLNEIGYGQLFGAPDTLEPLDPHHAHPLHAYPSLRTGIGFTTDYDSDFFISSSARPFESLGLMTTTSQFFPGMHLKSSLLEPDGEDEIAEDFPPPPFPLPAPVLSQTITPSLDFTTPDSGVEDITPGSTSTEEEYKKKLPESECWRLVDSGSSSESVSPSSPGGETLGGLRHTRDKLKLDLPPSPHIPSPRQNRVFNFVLDKPKRHRSVADEIPPTGDTPLVMTDETPIVTTSLPLPKECGDMLAPEPTFSTFGKCASKQVETEQKNMILTDDIQNEVKEEAESSHIDGARGDVCTSLDSGDEDSGIESSKATLERNKSTSNVS